MTNQLEWDYNWLAMAHHVEQWSRDLSTKVGCVVVGTANQVLTTGYNGFPRGINDYIPARYERPAKYIWTEHAERNAIYNAARTGVSLEGATIYTPWYPCADCGRGIIQSGIRAVVSHVVDYGNPRWGESFSFTRNMFTEAGIEHREIGSS